MIASLSGLLRTRSPDEIVVDVGGVGYQVFVSLQSYASLPAEGSSVELLTYTHVREDALQLFGFGDRAERALFLLLKEVNGIGPRLALNVLSGIPAGELRRALADGDLVTLTRIPGVGKKIAERMVVELREKVKTLAEDKPTPRGDGRGLAAEAASALVNLGFRAPDAERAVEAAIAGGKKGFEEVVREALRGIRR
jgi:Holliday junction DNA helicase RuvA